jgi:hypothetical protein
MTMSGSATASSLVTLQLTQPSHGLLGGPLLGIEAHQVFKVQFPAPVDRGHVQHFTVARPGMVDVSPLVPPDGLVDDDPRNPHHALRPEPSPGSR